MEAALRQSKAMCPFLKKASPAKLRALSTSARPHAIQAAPQTAVSPCGGTMSKLQLLAHRCPVMGKALTVQSAQYGHGRPAKVGNSSVAGIRALSTNSKPGRANIHTSRSNDARAVDAPSSTDATAVW
ncbi:5-aminolevulinate synthase [Colletotrichum tofieldiae]|nr:5-aminolevulinate synthase [Colletotrichum tofieldiae]